MAKKKVTVINLPNQVCKNEKQEALDRLKALDEKDIKACIEKYNASVEPILQEFGCKIIIQGTFVDNQIKSGLAIVKA
jgi:hypothetical protein